jgi:hypothetical protein
MRILIVLVALASAASAEAFSYDIEAKELVSYKIQPTPCKVEQRNSRDLGIFFDATIEYSLELSLSNGNKLVVKDDKYAFRTSAYKKTDACDKARRQFNTDETVRNYIDILESMRLRRPFYDSESGSSRCVIPSVRVFRSKSDLSISDEDFDFVLWPSACQL